VPNVPTITITIVYVLLLYFGKEKSRRNDIKTPFFLAGENHSK